MRSDRQRERGRALRGVPDHRRLEDVPGGRSAATRPRASTKGVWMALEKNKETGCEKYNIAWKMGL